ncbi:MAG TPA: sulfatase-like hydrolase/transferase [Gordonia sp. (in: high G+C Gram-positive bacteria)]|uniref:sulfatase-like hydrolase/transferase n=1 Tax=unclassified Gordonia (in: high G+C Gram-positive bacteria) TaxID=2657482 RepID=UPI000FA74496|nr:MULTISPECIES: sulfatase-like hydrolase/transferase [unclassified Gordonia (in: high G+C Gram-positive bacteria)]RUP40372.1 MAG: twin-arginine translocation signal domain-containing protein [Gordonia sp. (in: high G+C Gram-positive bacteria)]HNP57076.1 sulfatase-like hydrolase/transferase [Gordonia sp. (in: high G+C Gram-positive bacteria)]HRC49387.1 sulfatase-like hydrolase/transferase [Gordonia sp. (in: high G+C Gram-positive bacteria)]
MNPDADQAPSTVSRRDFLTAAAAGTAATALGAAAMTAGGGEASAEGSMVQRPNIILFITDQERKPMHWPKGWAARNLPNRQRLVDHGLSFENAFCAAAMCSPSRATFFTGKYPAEHGVTRTLTEGGTLSPSEPQLPLDEQNMAKILRAAGYRVHYRGKWHMSKAPNGALPRPVDIKKYGFDGWYAPDFGGDTKPSNFGGGCADHDGSVTSQAVNFLKNETGSAAQPFALIISLANPHDILSYPRTWNQREGNCDNYASKAPAAFRQGISLPASYSENLLTNFKPSAQVQSKVLLAGGLGPLPTPQGATDYVNFYAYLHKVVDQHLGTVLDTLDEKPAVRDRTVIVRISDHGEMGMAHGGLRQKIFNAYDETLRVPLIISNPVMFPRGATTTAMASLVDLMPTFATLAQVPDRARWTFRGTDLTPVIADAVARPGSPTAEVQDSVVFTFDDENVATPDGQNIVREPNHIRAIRDKRWKYAVYFDPDGGSRPQRELYDLSKDPHELINLADPGNPRAYQPKQVARMDQKLHAAMARTHTAPRAGVLR